MENGQKITDEEMWEQIWRVFKREIWSLFKGRVPERYERRFRAQLYAIMEEFQRDLDYRNFRKSKTINPQKTPKTKVKESPKRSRRMMLLK